MADYYTQFSAEIGDLTKEEREWLETYLKPPEDDKLNDDSYLEKWAKDRDDPYKKFVGDPEFWPHFEWLFEGDNWWIFSEESGLVDAVEYVVQKFLEKFRPQQYFSMEWAATCSKPRIDGFGGGAIFVTAKGSQWISTGQWVEDRVTKLNEDGGCSA